MSGAPVERARIGLCFDCGHRRVTGNRRGSRFYMCSLARTDARFAKYPPLPVIECAGYEQAPDPWAEFAE